MATNQGYFDWGSDYGRDPAWMNEEWLRNLYQSVIFGAGGYLENNVPGLWTRFISPWASGSDPFSRFVQSEFGKFWDSYDAAFATNPDLTRQQFVSNFGEEDFRRRFNALPPGQQGRNDARYGAGRMQWIV